MRQQVPHHPRVAHIVGELAVLRAYPEELCELGRLEFHVVPGQRERDVPTWISRGDEQPREVSLVLQDKASSVTLVHRRDQFRAHEGSVSQLRASKVDVLTPYVPHQILGGDDGRVRAVDVVNKETDEHTTIEVDEVVAALGFIADLGPLQSWGLTLQKRHIVVDSTMATNVPGVFAAGDVVEYPGKVRLISTGFGEAATAVNNAAPVIDPTAKVFPGHSSDPGKH